LTDPSSLPQQQLGSCEQRENGQVRGHASPRKKAKLSSATSSRNDVNDEGREMQDAKDHFREIESVATDSDDDFREIESVDTDNDNVSQDDGAEMFDSSLGLNSADGANSRLFGSEDGASTVMQSGFETQHIDEPTSTVFPEKAEGLVCSAEAQQSDSVLSSDLKYSGQRTICESAAVDSDVLMSTEIDKSTNDGDAASLPLKSSDDTDVENPGKSTASVDENATATAKSARASALRTRNRTKTGTARAAKSGSAAKTKTGGKRKRGGSKKKAPKRGHENNSDDDTDVEDNSDSRRMKNGNCKDRNGDDVDNNKRRTGIAASEARKKSDSEAANLVSQQPHKCQSCDAQFEFPQLLSAHVEEMHNIRNCER
jgi:hypothetical protein